MRVVGNIASDSEVVATASGAITAGKPVIVNADGTVAQTGITAASTGSVADAGFDSNIGGPYLTGLPGVSKFVGFARDQNNSYYGAAVVGVVSNSSISYGSVSSTSYGNYENFDVLGLTSTTFVLVYKDSGDGNKGKAVLGTVDASDNSITYGTVAQFEAGQTSMNDFGNAARLTDTTFVIAFEDASDSSKAKAIVGTVSGTSLSFGSPATFATANSSKYAAIGALSSTKIVIAYSDTPSSPPEDGEVIVGTVSGTSISFGSATQYDASRVIRHTIAALSDTKFVIAYNDDRTGNNYATAIAGTVSGTSITLGSPVVFRASDEGSIWPSVTKFTENDFVVAYLNDDLKPAAIKGSTSGTTITFGSSTELDSTAVSFIYGTTVNDEKIVAGFAPSSNLSAIVYNPSSANLTSENFIGFAKDAVANGAVATIQTANSIARDNIQDTTTSDTLGSEVGLGQNIANEDSTSMTFDSSNNKVVVFYVDASAGETKTVVGTVSGNSISFGTPASFTDSQYSVNTLSCVFDSNENKVVLAYVDTGDSNKGKAVVGTVSSSSISFGSEVEFESGRPYSIQSTFDSNSNRVVFVYKDSGNSYYFTSVVGSVSGSSISFGTPVVIASANYSYFDVTFDSNSNKVVVGVRGASSHGQSYVGTVDSSDNSISWGSVATFHSSGQPRYVGATFDTNANKVIFSYMAGGDSDKGYAVVGTVSGTDISFGTPTKFEDAAVKFTSIVFNSATNKVVVVYEDDANSDYTTYAVGTVSGTDISFDTAVVVSENDANEGTSIVFDSNSNKVVMQYGHSSDGKFRVLDVAGGLTDLTIGQQYFVQTDGTLSTSADSPSVIAGTAISGTDLIVKG
tara:strand:- start:1657 stop:4218 length:2562 start_codon:yes stop_codon:yes gene_type:complete